MIKLEGNCEKAGAGRLLAESLRRGFTAFERADHEGIDYEHWRFERVFLLVPAQAFVAQWLQSFAEFPPRQKPGSFSLDQVMDKIVASGRN